MQETNAVMLTIQQNPIASDCQARDYRFAYWYFCQYAGLLRVHRSTYVLVRLAIVQGEKNKNFRRVQFLAQVEAQA